MTTRYARVRQHLPHVLLSACGVFSASEGGRVCVGAIQVEESPGVQLVCRSCRWGMECAVALGCRRGAMMCSGTLRAACARAHAHALLSLVA